MTPENKEIRHQLKVLIKGGKAHLPFEKIVAGIPEAFYNSKFASIPYSPWEILEHMRIAQWDILEFVLNPEHKSPKWPEGYWPAKNEAAGPVEWSNTLNRFRDDMQRVESIIENPSADLFEPLPHAKGYSIFREILLIADHNAYHLGQLIILKRLLKIRD